MAITFDAVTSNNSASSTSLTYSHTCGSGSDRMLFVGCGSGGGDRITGITYGGVSMTQVGKQQMGATSGWGYLFCLPNPASGANNVVVSASPSTAINCMATSYAGVTQSATMDAVATSSLTVSASSFSTSVTTIADNCWTICYTINDTNVFSANSDTIRGSNVGGNLFDSNSAITPAGNKTMTQNVAGTKSGAVVMCSFSPSGVAATFIPKITFL